MLHEMKKIAKKAQTTHDKQPVTTPSRLINGMN